MIAVPAEQRQQDSRYGELRAALLPILNLVRVGVVRVCINTTRVSHIGANEAWVRETAQCGSGRHPCSPRAIVLWLYSFLGGFLLLLPPPLPQDDFLFCVYACFVIPLDQQALRVIPPLDNPARPHSSRLWTLQEAALVWGSQLPMTSLPTSPIPRLASNLWTPEHPSMPLDPRGHILYNNSSNSSFTSTHRSNTPPGCLTQPYTAATP